MDLQAIRKDYTTGGLDEADLARDPFAQFDVWFEQAKAADLIEPNGMTLATVGADGMPSARTVLLKGVDVRGLVFFTNYESRKAAELEAAGKAAALFWWPPLERQVRFEGAIERVAPAESDTYFASRPRGARIGAWASRQSQPITSRRAIEKAVAGIEARFGDGDVPRPPHWGGYRLNPRRVEFWQGRADRLHDRLVYSGGPGDWQIARLSP